MFRTENSCKNRKREMDKNIFQKENNIFDNIHDAMAFLEGHYSEPVKKTFSRPNSTPQEVHEMLRSKLSSTYYQKNDLDAVINTLEYMYFRHKKLIFVSIRDNRVKVYMQVINRRFRNPLADFMKLDRSTEHYMQENFYRKKELNPDFEVPQIKFNDPSTWSVLNCLVGNVLQLTHRNTNGFEVDYFFTELKKFLELVCRSRSIPDADFFLNVHDQVILHKDMIVPYKNIVGDKKIPINRYRGKQLAPILSFSTGDDYIDLPMVFPDDIRTLYKSTFMPKCSSKVDFAKFNMDWSSKKPTAIFRGTATGCGFTVENNPRLRLVYLSRKWNVQHKDMFDIALVGTDEIRFKKHASEKFVRYYIEKRVEQEPEKKMDLVEQSNYKYLIYVEGNVAAYRLSGMFAMGSVVVYVESEYKPWYYDLLVDKVNCVKCKSVDDLLQTIRWCRAHDDKCKEIVLAGKELYNKYFTKKGLLDYTATLIRSINTKV